MNSQALRLALPAGFLAALPLDTAGQDGFVECTRVIHTWLGESAGDQFGWVSAPITDLDGDGADEVAITAPTFGSPAPGRVYVYSGATGELRFHVDGPFNNASLGQSVADAGDVDGDGLHDIIAGAPGPGSGGVSGRALVISGADGSVIWTIVKGSPSAAFGSAVAGLGDLDGDGFDDLAIGGSFSAGSGAGRVWVISGADGTTLLWDAVGEATGDLFGSGVGNAGDLNGDGKNELVVGAPGAGPGGRGKAYVYDVVADTLLWETAAEATGVNFGQYFVSGVGDVDADGTPDVYVGDFNDGENGTSAGKMYVLDGATGDPLWVLPGNDPGDGFGIGRGAGDVNNDGHADLLMCGWQDGDGAANAGAAYVISGADGSVLRKITSTTAGDTFGFDAHGIGDVDADGRLDYFVTAAWNDEVGSNAGKCYLVAGGEPVTNQGAGLAGTGGFVPAIGLGGCPELDVAASVEITDGLGGGAGLIVFGTMDIAVPFFGGTLGVLPTGFLGHALDGVAGAAGGGAASLAFQTPASPAVVGTALYLQGLYADAGAPFGAALTPVLRLIFG